MAHHLAWVGLHTGGSFDLSRKGQWSLRRCLNAWSSGVPHARVSVLFERVGMVFLARFPSVPEKQGRFEEHPPDTCFAEGVRHARS